MYIRKYSGLSNKINIDWNKVLNNKMPDKPKVPIYAYIGVGLLLTMPALVLITKYWDWRNR